MGTRSLLAVEDKPGRLHVQYMQFDGYPTCKGKQFYNGVVRGMTEAAGWDEGGKPGKAFFKRVRHFLDEYQYQSGHSIGNHFRATLRKFLDADSWQEWQYWFDASGDFHVIRTGLDREVIIPWGITNAFAEMHYEARDILDGKALDPLWEKVETWFGDEPGEPACTLADMGIDLAFKGGGVVSLSKAAEKASNSEIRFVNPTENVRKER
jgi:hypothetical protein